MSIIDRTPNTWYRAKWPFPKPSYFVKNHDFVDEHGRFYTRVSQQDARLIEIRQRPNHTAYWVALPPRCSMYLSVGDRVQDVGTSQTYRAVAMEMDWMPRRRIAITSLRVGT